jgi:hypothetical protein
LSLLPLLRLHPHLHQLCMHLHRPGLPDVINFTCVTL